MSRADVADLTARKRRRPHAWLPWLLGVLALAIVGLAVYAVYFSSWLDLEEVKVNGDRTLPASRVVAVADAPLGEPLASVDIDAVAERVAAMPQVASVDVQREWPHAMRIVVTEREPLARLRDRNRWVALDAEGVVFPTSDPLLKALPLVKVRGGVNYADAETLKGLATTVAALPQRIARQVTQVTAKSQDSITLTLTKGRTVVWGSAEQAEAKAKVLATALAKVKATRYDVSVPARLKTSK